MTLKTADLYDAHGEALQIVELSMRDYGGLKSFCGPIATVKLYEDNSFVKKALSQEGTGRVLVVDGGGSMRYALLGDRLAQLACDSGWAGLIIFGCIRDSEDIASMPLGVKALGTIPRKTVKRDRGDHEVVVRFGGVTFKPGHFLYADPDGIVVSSEPLQP